MADAAALSPDIIAKIDAFTVNGFNAWKDSATEEQKAAALAMHEEMKSNPEKMAEVMTTITNQFNTADVNSDGVLDRQEWEEFCRLSNEHSRSKGQWVYEGKRKTLLSSRQRNLVTIEMLSAE